MCEGTNVVFSRKLTQSFIELYKDLPCLWDRYCGSYKVKQKRHDAITKLTKLVQEYDSSATRVHVLRKIESLRACVRREHKKVRKSRLNAARDDDVYQPQLWYYNMFSFVFASAEYEEDKTKEPATASSPESNAESEVEDVEEEDDDDEEHPFETNLQRSYTEYTSSSLPDVPETSNKRYSSYEEEKNKRHCTEIEDEYDAIGINVAAKLRHLRPNMRILAEKLINDVLFHAQTSALSSASTICTPDPFK